MTSLWQRTPAPSSPLPSDEDEGSEATPPSPPPGVSPRRRLALVGLALAFTLACAVLGDLVLDVAQGTRGLGRALDNVGAEPVGVIVLSSLLLWFALLVLVAVTGRVILSAGIFATIVLGIGFANHAKLALRQEPIYPADLTFLSQPGFLSDMVSRRSLVLMVVMVVVLPVGAALLGRALRRRLPRISRTAEPRTWRAWVVGRVCLLLLVPLVWLQLAAFNDGGNPVRAAYEAGGVDWANHSQRSNYVRNGMVGGFLYNLNVPAMKPPPGYSKATMAAVAQRWQDEARRMNATLSPSALGDVNVVLVLSEALSDPTRVSGVSIDQDPMPFTRKLMSRTPSGSLLTQTIGAGTANMEFEALTGFSLAQYLPQMTTPYQMLVQGDKTFPSAVSWFEDHGHGAVAVHPYGPRMYQRDKVYPVLGFDKFIYDDTMTVPRTHDEQNNLIDDDAAFKQAEAELDQSDDPLFLQLITMQNHYPFKGKYDDPVPVEGVTGETADQLGAYARGVQFSDDALKAFLHRLKQSDEKTVVLLYGDHTPAFWASTHFADEQKDTLRQTPYFLWSNYQKLQPEDLGVTSAMYFLPLLFQQTGQSLPPFYALLLQLHQAIPAMEQDLAYSSSGFAPTVTGLDAHDQQVLDDYRLVQYDLSVGQRYSLAAMTGDDGP